MATSRTLHTRALARARLAIAALCLLAGAGRAAAHGMRLGALRLEEVSATRAIARWTTTVPHAGATPMLPAGCTITPLGDLGGDGGDGPRIDALDCPGGLVGRTAGVRGLGGALTEATVLVRFLDGRTASQLLTAGAPDWTLPPAQDALGVAASYVVAGVVHIATGGDHLLFLVLLALALRRVRAVLLAETAFTISHSIAFSVTALGWLRIPAAPAEACIALSLILLALDVGAAPVLAARRGALVALVFGVVHGLGFAGGLRELGLPADHAAWALAGFGAGVELGQLGFLAGVLGALAVLARLRLLARLAPLGAAAVGAVATSWLVERLVASFHA